MLIFHDLLCIRGTLEAIKVEEPVTCNHNLRSTSSSSTSSIMTTIVVNKDLTNNSFDKTTDCDASSSTSVESSSQEGSRQQEVQEETMEVTSQGSSQSEENVGGESKLVKITVISLDGVVAKKFLFGNNRQRNLDMAVLTALNILRIKLLSNK